MSDNERGNDLWRSWGGLGLIDVLASPRSTPSSQPLRGEGGQTEPGKTLLLFNEHKDD